MVKIHTLRKFRLKICPQLCEIDSIAIFRPQAMPVVNTNDAGCDRVPGLFKWVLKKKHIRFLGLQKKTKNLKVRILVLF